MPDNRMIELLEAAADELEDGRDPFDRSFLIEHDVTADECFALAGAMAAGATVVAALMKNPALARGAVNGAQTVLAYQQLNRALSKLG